MADEDDDAALSEVALPLKVNLGHERAGRVDYGQVPRFRRGLYGLRHAVRAEDRDGGGRNLVDLVDKARAFRLQVLDDVLVVHDLVADKNGRLVLFQCALDDRNRPDHAGAKSTWLGEHHSHRTAFGSTILHRITPCL